MATKVKTQVPAVRKGTDVVSVDELMKQQAANIASRIQQPGGAKIQVTQSKSFKMPDGSVSNGPIDVVILDFISTNFYYDSPYKEGEPKAPACFAMGTEPNDDLAPDESSPDMQGDEDHKCKGCEHNQFGTKGDGKACQNRVLLAVLPPDADEDTPIMTVSLSPTALKAFASYAATLASVLGLPPVGVVSSIGFDPKLDYSSLRFGKPTELDPDRKAFFVLRQKEAMDKLMVKPDVSTYEAPKQSKRVPIRPAARR